ncbi:MAG: hypothetical protein HONDAALG_02923 [Gammaproteobacteria bacterium]|nr:hypothetical protein [Gammaproteobacteria bacterium]
MSTAIHEDLAINLPADLQENIARTREMAKYAPPITINPQRMNGTPVIGIQRIPVVSLIDHLMGGYTVEEFLDSFPGTDRDKVMAILQMIKDKLAEGWMAEEVN